MSEKRKEQSVMQRKGEKEKGMKNGGRELEEKRGSERK